MAEKLPDHQTIEESFKATRELVTNRLPDVTESREARRLLIESEKLAYIAREQAARREINDA